MIKVLFPPGCYGNYFTKCLYSYSNLRTEQLETFTFDKNGSSHDRRYHTQSRDLIRCGHLGQLDILPGDQIVSLIAHPDHYLDYFNNQLVKQQNNQLIEYLTSHVDQDQIEKKFQEQWGYSGGLTKQTPRWILREWCSYWLEKTWDHTYNNNDYREVGNVKVDTKDIVNNIEATIVDVFDQINLQLTVDREIINSNHTNFLACQQFHNSQIACTNLVHNVIHTDLDTHISIQTIFDEAYIQYLLRTQDFEMYCDGLEIMPSTSHQIKKIIYKK